MLRFGLAAEAVLGDDAAVALDVVLADVVEKAPTPAHHLQEASAGVMVALVHLEVIVEVVDPLRKDGDLHLWRARVRLVETVRGDGCWLVRHG